MTLSRLALALALFASPLFAAPAITVTPKGAALTNGRVHLEITGTDIAKGTVADVVIDGKVLQQVTLTGEAQEVVAVAPFFTPGQHVVEVRAAGATGRADFHVVRGWLSILPPLIAIVLALVFKQVIVSLAMAIFAGALIMYDWNPLTAFARSIDTIIAPALGNLDHAKIVVFTMLIGGMVALVSKSGGTQGIVNRLQRYATTPRRGQVATWMMGILIFFDDYANTLIVGSTMRPITDRLRISREKLAYIVDSTAAPVASLFPISTWIGFEVGLIAAAFTQLGIPFNPYVTFIESIPYRFYPIFALVLGFTIAFACRDFGPMLKAELRASETGDVVAPGDKPLADYSESSLQPSPDTPRRAINAFLPILTVIVVTVVGMYVSGASGLDRANYTQVSTWLRDVFSNASSIDTLLWASLSSVVVALALALGQRILTLRESMDALTEGFKSMLLAIVVLILAWGIGMITGELHTADFVVGLTEGVLSPYWFPVLVFAASAAIAFATGTSWGTMAILMPLAIPIIHRMSIAAGHSLESPAYHVFLLGTVSSVLAGSVWGDHCSPISDTTILSSMGSACDHIAHVRTQLPYALAIGVLGMLIGDIPTAYGLNPWISILLGSTIIIAGVLLLGKRSDWRQTTAGS